MKPPRQRNGYTLVEVVVVLAIIGFALTGLAKLLVDLSRSSFVTAEKLDINADIRQFTLEMADNARAANKAYIYRSFRLTDRNDSEDRVGEDNHGDFLLLVFQQPYPGYLDDPHITRLVGYFRDADPNNRNATGPVKRFDLKFHDPNGGTVPAGSAGPYPNSTVPLEQLISRLSSAGDYPTVVQLSRGLADGQLFYNLNGTAIMVKAQIIHGNAAKRITDTYNYTVSPKG